MDDPAKTTPWFIHLAELVALIAFVWVGLTEGIVRAVGFIGISIISGALVLLVVAVREAILRRYRG
jgi:hypothetical protein